MPIRLLWTDRSVDPLCYRRGVFLELAVGASLVAAATYALRAMRRGPPVPAPIPEEDEEIVRGPRGLRLGDVLLYADSELWLAGAVELQEEGLVVRAFRTPGAKRCTWLLQLNEDATKLATANPTDDVPAGRVPSELPMGGFRLRLKRKGRATIQTAAEPGQQLPPTSEEADFSILEGPGGRLLLVIDFEGQPRLALLAQRAAREMFELLPGGD